MDEFLLIKTGNGTLSDLMKVVPESDCLHLNCRVFGNSGYEVLTDQLVTERFVMANFQLGAADHFGAYKCLFRPGLFQRPGIHRPTMPKVPSEDIRYSNGSGLAVDQYDLKDAISTDPGGCEFAQINHYITRDLASFMLKFARGSARQSDRPVGPRYWKMGNKNFEIDDGMQPMLARTKARMAALDTASGGRLMRLREAAIFDHLARYYTMLQEPQMRAFRQMCKDNPNATGFDKPKPARPAKPAPSKAARTTGHTAIT